MATILTWNMQGGQGDGESKWTTLGGVITNPTEYGLATSPDYIFVQECSMPQRMITPATWVPLPVGTPAQITRGSINFGTSSRPKCYFIAHYAWPGTRVSFAILVSTACFPSGTNQVSADLSANVRFHNPATGNPNHRPIIGVMNGGAGWYSMHAPSGVVVGTSRTYVDGMINAVMATSYVIGGDFNQEPETLYNAGYPIPHGQLDTSGQATHGNNELDYFTSDNNAGNNTALNNVRIVNLQSDHSAVAADH